jgi:hypothetical protein
MYLQKYFHCGYKIGFTNGSKIALFLWTLSSDAIFILRLRYKKFCLSLLNSGVNLLSMKKRLIGYSRRSLET